MRIQLLVLSFCTVMPLAHSQQSLFETGDGKTALYLRAPAAAFNFGDSKASVAAVHDVSTEKIAYGIGLYATANNGVTSLYTSGKPKAPEGGIDGTVGRVWSAKGPDCGQPICNFAPEDRRVLLDVGYGRSSFTLYPTNAAPTASTSKTYFDRYRLIAATNLSFGGQFYIGLASGVERRNNLSDLKSVSTQTTVVPSASGGTTTIVSTQTGYYGDYKKYVAVPVYEDAMYITPQFGLLGLKNRLGIDALTRSDAGSSNRTASGGIGLFLLNKDDPFKVVGGITATYDGTKFQISITTGLTGSSK
ncbi:MAG: hypothetical protein JWQ42_2726 [Edaphobacter sp.]|nr:hypothetical protein [Edaphobacter sp.]